MNYDHWMVARTELLCSGLVRCLLLCEPVLKAEYDGDSGGTAWVLEYKSKRIIPTSEDAFVRALAEAVRAEGGLHPGDGLVIADVITSLLSLGVPAHWDASLNVRLSAKDREVDESQYQVTFCALAFSGRKCVVSRVVVDLMLGEVLVAKQ